MNTAKVDSDALDEGAPAEPEELSLAAGFPAPTREEWAALVDEVVRKAGRIGADAEPGAGVDKLTWSTPDGITGAAALHRRRRPGRHGGVPGAAPFVRGSRADGPAPDGWDVRQRHAEPDAEAANAAVLADLENGVTSVWLAVGTGGVPVADLPAALDGVLLDLAPVVLDASGDAADTELAAAEAFLALAADRGVAPDALLGTLGLDPVGRRARTGDRARTSPRSSRSPGGWPPSSRRSARSWSTRSRCTARAPPTRRSWAGRSPRAWPTCAS